MSIEEGNPQTQISFEDIVNKSLKEANEALKDPYVFKSDIQKVAVIGAGPSGLVSARHLKEAGLSVRVFDRNSYVGGVWVYSERPRPKPKMPTSRVARQQAEHATAAAANSATDEPQKKLFEMTPEMQNLLLTKKPPSACYRDLYNNTATHLMALPDFPFPENTPLYIPHFDIAEYLENYANEFDLMPLIEFDTSVDLVTKNQEDHTWELTLSKYDVYTSGMVRETRWKETFDAVVVASGQHQDPYVPDIKDLTAFNKIYPDKMSHSVQYRKPEDYKDKNVLVVGGSVSAVDIVRSLEGFAKTITISIKGPFDSPFVIYQVLRSLIPKCVDVKPEVKAFSNAEGQVDGSVIFEDDSTLDNIDQVIFCSGFNSRMPFLGDLVIPKGKEDVRYAPPRPIYDDVPESHVVLGPQFPLNVYRESFLISDPTMAFVGQPPFFSPLSQYDTQARAVARVWSGAALLPNENLMLKYAAEHDDGLSPLELFNGDRRRREPLIVWLNHHATSVAANNGKEYPPLENYREDYEEEGLKSMKHWVVASTENFKKAREHNL
ncbi:FAD dependent oxidoreductase [Mucor ambiguus]|uniref:FAD dependent oxidoreductase n=1 Tax=Mucor ambiguus TaxID=91626 RepID=A0A0C9MFT0_9FUNG|nr:FAD dependent oxidoreductase [Mucor ambiguus]